MDLSQSWRAWAASWGLLKSSAAERARVLAATTMPLRPSEVPAAAVDIQVWRGVPGGKVAAWKWPVGTTQLTSPTSVEA